MSLEKVLKYILVIAGTALGLSLLPFVLRIFAPFVLAFFVALPCQRIVKKLEDKWHINRGVSSAVISVLIVAFGTGLVIFLSMQIFSQGKNLVNALPAGLDSLKGQIGRVSQSFERYKLDLPKEVSVMADNVMLSIKEASSKMSSRAAEAALSTAGGVASALPGAALFLMMFILGTFFFTKDYDLVINFLKEALPQKVVSLMIKTKTFFVRAFSLYIKAQLILMVLTTALVTVLLWIVGVRYPLLWGVISGLLDMLPLLGTAVVLLPLSFFALLYGDIYQFVGILLVQVIVFLTRQIAEPKVVSHQIGIHPILTLVGVYVGLRFFGVLGMILSPLLIFLAVNLYVSYKENAENIREP